MKKYRVRFEVPRDSNLWVEVRAVSEADAKMKAKVKAAKDYHPPIKICEATEL